MLTGQTYEDFISISPLNGKDIAYVLEFTSKGKVLYYRTENREKDTNGVVTKSYKLSGDTLGSFITLDLGMPWGVVNGPVTKNKMVLRANATSHELEYIRIK